MQIIKIIALLLTAAGAAAGTTLENDIPSKPALIAAVVCFTLAMMLVVCARLAQDRRKRSAMAIMRVRLLSLHKDEKWRLCIERMTDEQLVDTYGWMIDDGGVL